MKLPSAGQGLNTIDVENQQKIRQKLPRQVFFEEHLLVHVLAGQAHAPLVEEPRHGAEVTLGLGAGGRGAQVLLEQGVNDVNDG